MTTKKSSDNRQMDDEYEIEEFLVYVDLDTTAFDNKLQKNDIKFLGLDTDAPIMQLNNRLYKGTYEYAMGTHCFFKESSRPGGLQDACFQEQPPVLHDFFGKTNKVLKMRRIFVEEKETDGDDGLAEGEIENLDHLKVTKTYGEALNQFLKPGEKPPRDVDEVPIRKTIEPEMHQVSVEAGPSSQEQTLEIDMFKLTMEHTKKEIQTDIDSDDDNELTIDTDFNLTTE